MDGLSGNYQVAPSQQVEFTSRGMAPGNATPPPTQVEDGDKKLRNALIGLGVTAVAGIALYKTGTFKKIGNLFKKNAGKAADAATDASQRTGKKLTEVVENAQPDKLQDILKKSDAGISRLNNSLQAKTEELTKLELELTAAKGAKDTDTINKLTQQITDLKKGIEKTKNEILRNHDLNRQAIERLSKEGASLQDDVQAIVNKENGIQKNIKSVKDALLPQKQKLLSEAKEKADIDKYQAEIDELNKLIENSQLGYTESIDKLRKQANTLDIEKRKTGIDNANKRIKELKNKLDILNGDPQNHKAINAAENEIKRYQNGIADLNNKISELSQ